MEENEILLIGDGRLAHHLRYYLNSRGYLWHTTPNEQSRIALLAISDDAIESVAQSLPGDLAKIHFSGSVASDLAIGIHPLMTFRADHYPFTFYDQIPLVVDNEALELKWVKELPNPKTALPKDQKALYHGLCHLSGNFPKLLWEEAFEVLERQLKIPRQFFRPYLEQVLSQVINGKTDLKAGPFGRGDKKTIQAHFESLNEFPELKKSYTHFYESFNERNANELT